MELTIFNEKHLESFKSLADLERQKKDIEEQSKSIRQFILNEMCEHNLASIDNEYVKLTVVPMSESFSIDLKALLVDDPDLYHELESKYNKRTTRKASLRVTVR